MIHPDVSYTGNHQFVGSHVNSADGHSYEHVVKIIPKGTADEEIQDIHNVWRYASYSHISKRFVPSLSIRKDRDLSYETIRYCY